MKRSQNIMLITAAVALASCDSAPPPDRIEPNKFDAYNSKQECVREWNEEACQKRYDNHSRGLVWVGPHYINNAPVWIRPDGSRQYRQASAGVNPRSIFVPPVSSVSHFRPMAYTPSTPAMRTSVPSVSSRGGFGGTAVSVGTSSSGG